MQIKAVAVMTAWLAATPALGQGLTGYCLDNGDAGCMPRYLPFHGLSVDFCEETCTLTNPVSVRDLDGTLYDSACGADYPTDKSGRVLILRQSDFFGNTKTLFIDKSEVAEIVPCP